jgi:type VI secretion system protein ImpA
MPFPHVIDIENLLQPISMETPHGTDLRADRSPTSDYYSLKDARNNARAAERSSMFDDAVDLQKPWRTVVDLAPNILGHKSKDLEVACWLTEGLIRLHGVAGLRDGFRLIHGLIENYWQNLYPQPDEDGMETKVAPLTGLNGDGGDGTLMAPIRNMGITNEGDYGSFNLWQYLKARDNAKVTDEDERHTCNESLGFTLQDIEDTIREAAPQFYADMVATIEEALIDYRAITTLLRSHCGQEAPPSSNIAALLDEVLRSVRFLSKDKLDAIQTAAGAQHIDNSEFNAADSLQTENLLRHITSDKPAKPSGPIGNREDALRRLQEVADYFRLNEPHTPLAPGIERLIRWGRMTVAELMMELLPEDSSRGFFSQLTGLKLDGSDVQKYTPPATPAAAASVTSATPTQADKPVEPAPAAAAQASGW